jgi:hypothetical protein
MDPCLERRGLWEGVHTRLIVAIADTLAPLVWPTYRVEEIKERYLEIRSVADSEVVTVIELLSHSNEDRAGYDLAIDYGQPAVPPLREEDAAWAAQFVSQGQGEQLG